MQPGGTDLSGVQAEAGAIDITSTESAPAETTGATSESNTTTEPKDESPRETVSRVLREAQEKDSGGEGSEPQEAETPAGAKLVKPSQSNLKPKGQQKPESFQIPPPARLKAAEKEVFNSMPDPLKRAAHAMFKNQEATFTRAMQQVQAEAKEVTHMREAVRPYLLSHPELAEQGFTESRFISALVSAHQKLTNPKTAKEAWLELAPQVGIDADTIKQLREGVGTPQTDITAHPQFVALQQKLNSIESKQQSVESEKHNAAVSRVLSEMEATRDEKDSAGRYLYPELHEEAFLDAAKPLVSALVRAIPNLSYGEALKRAYFTLKGQSGNSNQVNQARFSNQNTNNLARAQQAAVSVRGRSAPSVPGNLNTIPPEALRTPKETVAWALQQLRRG